MAEHTIVVYGKPLAQPRARATVVGGFARVYDDRTHPVHVFKAQLRLQAGELFQSPCDGPVWLRIEAVFPRPKSKTRKTRPNLREWHTSKPDCENVAKAVMDALTHIVYHDDRQVVSLNVIKCVASGDEQARTEVTISHGNEKEG